MDKDMRKKLKAADDKVYLTSLTAAEQAKEAHKSMAKWFISGGINPNTTNLPSFANVMHLLIPDFPFRLSHAEKQILEIHDEYKEKAKKFLKEFDGKITLSYESMLLRSELNRDYIQGPLLHEDFACMTAHFIDDDWKIQRWVLGFDTDMSGFVDDIIVYHFNKAVEDFKIHSKVSAILLPNNHSDLDGVKLGAFRNCIEEEGNDSTNPSPISAIYCCADFFRLMVNDLFSELSWSSLEDVRMLIGWGRCSSSNWNVTLSHLQQAVDMKAKDAFSKDEMYDDYDKPSDEEWIKIETFCKLAGCIYKVAAELFEGGYSTSNVYFHLLAELKVMFSQELANAGNDYFISKAKKILKRFDKYWNHMFLILAAASVLDPRLKMKYVEFYCSKSEVSGESSKAETVLEYLRSLYGRYATSDSSEESECDHEGREEEDRDEEKGDDDDHDDDDDDDHDDDDEEEGYCDEEEEEEREGRKEREKRPDACKNFAFFQEFLKLEGSLKKKHESELDAYLKEPIIEWNKNFRALEWWREESQKYPNLSRVARDILSIPISRATSYDAYVLDKREPPECVVSLEPEVANAMMCSRKWLGL